MKRSLVFIYLFVACAPLVRTYWPLTAAQNSEVWERFSMPLRLATLATQPADSELLMPVALPVKQVRDTWQAARSGGRLHQGQDLFAPRKTEVYAATAGYVVRIGENTLGGKTVSVLGAGGRVYYYAHLADYAPALTVGDAVTPATLLGYVGTTGNARNTPPHLHFGVYTTAGAINPLPLLRERPPARKGANG